MVRLAKTFVAMALALLAAACGGGGGGGGGGPQAPRGTLSVSTTNLTFIANGPNAPTPASQTVSGSVTGVSGGTLVINIVGTGTAIAAISPVILTSDTSGQATVSVPPPATLGVGTYTGTITVRACMSDPNCASGNLSGSPQTINVTYHVAALQSSVAALDYTIVNSPDASDRTRVVTITGVPAQSWTMTSNVSWLSVPASGAPTGGSLNATIVQAAADQLVNGTYTGSLRVTPSVAGTPIEIPVTLTVRRTQVNYVAPYVAYSGTSKEVIVRGDEFTEVSNVLFGTTPAAAFTVVSPTEIRATYPNTLPTGHLNVKLQSGFAARSFADLAVVDAPVFIHAERLEYPDTLDKTPNAIVYDAERAAIGVSVWYHNGATAFIRYKYNNGATLWLPPESKSLANNFGAALSADGTEWIVGSGTSLIHLNANDLTQVAQTPPVNLQTFTNFATASNGRIVMFSDVFFGCGATLALYDPRKRELTQPGFTACRGNLGISGDGSRTVLLNESTDFSTDDVLTLDTDSGATTPTGVHMLTGKPPVLSRDGSRMVLQRTQVRDGSFNLLGNLPATTDAVVLSPDGKRAYAFDHSGQFITYDLNAAPVAGEYPAIGSPVTLAGDPGPLPALPPPPYSDEIVMMTITPDGSAVFIAGDKGIVVQPTH